MDKYNIMQFKGDLNELEIDLNDRQIKQFMDFYEILIEWNSFMNLTAITDFDEVMKKHFIDSLSLVKVVAGIRNDGIKLIDIGTGAGFPGIPLKIAFPDLQVTLLDSLNKRIRFLDEVIFKLQLKNIDTIHGRAEDYAKQENMRESFDYSVSRAVANLATLSEYCLPFVKVGGCFISYKSEKLTEEIMQAKNAVNLLGGEIKEQAEFMLPASDIHRNLLVISKVKNTPSKYPRKSGLPAKEPII